jgi:hypothetical protein
MISKTAAPRPAVVKANDKGRVQIPKTAAPKARVMRANDTGRVMIPKTAAPKACVMGQGQKAETHELRSLAKGKTTKAGP